MNRRALGILSVVAFVIIGAAVWMGYARSPRSTEQTSLYPSLKGKLASVSGLSIYKAQDQLAVELAKDGANWKVKQRNDFPADVVKVNQILIALEGAVIHEQKTSNPDNYSALAVQDLSDASTSGIRIELAGTSTPVNLIVGKKDGGTRSTFVRRAGEKESWLIGGELDVPAEPGQWLKKELLNVGADRVQEASIDVSGSPSYSAFKSTRADANFDVRGIPKGRELNSVTVANPAAQALSALQMDDVRPASELANEKKSAHAEFRTFDGLIVEFVGYPSDEHRWITVKASFSPELATKFRLVAQPADKGDKEASAIKETAPGSQVSVDKGVEAEAAAINSATAGWAFSVPNYKYDAIFKPIEDLLKKTDLMKKK